MHITCSQVPLHGRRKRENWRMQPGERSAQTARPNCIVRMRIDRDAGLRGELTILPGQVLTRAVMGACLHSGRVNCCTLHANAAVRFTAIASSPRRTGRSTHSCISSACDGNKNEEKCNARHGSKDQLYIPFQLCKSSSAFLPLPRCERIVKGKRINFET